MFRSRFIFCGEELLTPRLTPKLEDHSLSGVRGCPFNISAAGGRSCIRNPRMRHAVVTRAHLAWQLCCSSTSKNMWWWQIDTIIVCLDIVRQSNCMFVKFFIAHQYVRVVETLCYKPEGRGLETRLEEWFCSFCLILPAALSPEFTQPLTEMGTRSRKIIFLGSRAQPVHMADNLTAICEPIV
jgi:hypothetical protein